LIRILSVSKADGKTHLRRLWLGNNRRPATFIRHSGDLLGTTTSRRGIELWDCSHTAHIMEAAMKIRHFLVGATTAIGLGLAAASAQAAPGVATGADLTSVARESSNVDQVYWTRRCWRHAGHLHCRRLWVDYGYGPYYYDEPYYYRPAFGFFFGGQRHHHHFRRW
jgi:hypothetical protein